MFVTFDITVVIFVALFTFSFDSRHTLTFEEIYCGFVFIGIGVFGLYTLKRVSLTCLTPFMILNIFGCIFALITMVLACVRIFMLDRRHENYLMMKQEDLLILPKLNCTKDVIGKCYLTMLDIRQNIVACAESLHHKNLPKTFGQSILNPPSAEEIKYNIQQCEIMKIEAINEANQALSSAAGEGLGSSAPRIVYQLEVCRKYFYAR